MEKQNQKFILDACCGTKMMWINKNHPHTLYIDIRKEPKGFIKEQPNSEINPDIVASFTNLPFVDKKFKLIVCDPPHIIGKRITGIIMKKFGCLCPETWQDDLKTGFKEMWRCLDDYGTLILKWNNVSIPYKKMLSYIPIEPLFYNVLSGEKAKKEKRTFWFCFMKIPSQTEEETYIDKKWVSVKEHNKRIIKIFKGFDKVIENYPYWEQTEVYEKFKKKQLKQIEE